MSARNDIFSALAAAARRGESVALGIITGVKGSSPQKVGAKAIFYTDQRIDGTLGGGCLEAEAQRMALQSLKSGKPATFDLVLDHDFGWDDGLICGGKVFGVIVPDAQKAGEKFWSELAARKSTMGWGVKKDFSIVRVVAGGISKIESAHATSSCTSPSPRPSPSGEGELSPDILRTLALVSSDEASKSVEGDPDSANEWLYEETVAPPCALWIAGSGHIAQAVAPLALQLDFAVTIFDDRPELANHDFFPKEVSLRTGNWGELCEEKFPETPVFGLVVTRGHKHDALVLETWIHRPFQFLGMIGSSRKARTITEHFISKKIATAEEVARVACPVGIKIKSQSVMEIGVSIMAQYIEKRAELVKERRLVGAGKVELV